MRRRYALVSLIGAGSLLLFATVSVRAPGEEVPLYRPRRERFELSTTAEGSLEPVRTTPITAPVTRQGPVKIAWLAADGTRVRRGDVVVRFDPTDMEALLFEGELGRAIAESQLQENTAQTAAALANLDRDRELAEEELALAEKFQSKDPEIFSRNDILESELDRHLAASKLDHATAQRELKERLSRLERSIFGIDERQALEKIELAEEGLSLLEVRAPHDGILIVARDWRREPRRVGDVVFSGQPIAELPALEEMRAEVHVLEADAGRLAEGARASVVLEAHPDETFPARIESFDRIPRPVRPGLPVQYFTVRLRLERTDPRMMKPGQRVRATLLLGSWDDALAIPRQAVFEEDGKHVVYRRRDGRFEPVVVELGPAAASRVLVEHGLREGDSIALRDPTRSREELVPLERTSAP